MKLATYRYDDGIGPGAILDGEIADLRPLSGSMAGLIATGSDSLEPLRAALSSARRWPLAYSRLLSPIPNPRLFLGIGLNYRDHAAETGRALGEHPTIFAKLPGTAAGPYDEIGVSTDAATLDYEGELGFVVSRRCRNIEPQEARSCIWGFFVVNDVTVRALSRPETLILAKSGSGYGPFGPWITTADEIEDPHALRLRTWVNSELRQDSSTAQMHRSCWELLSYLSRTIWLEAGDIITTGSPAGSGVGLKPPQYLHPGDTVRVEIEGLGSIENRFVRTDEATGRLGGFDALVDR